MKKIAIIPARYNSSRFIGKPLYKIKGKPMIQWVYESIRDSQIFDDVIIATDDKRIYNKAISFNGNCVITSSDHESGTDRVNEVAKTLNLNDEDIVFNVQGDEPLVNKTVLNDLLKAFAKNEVKVATLKYKIQDIDEISDSNVVKVVCDLKNNALFFSRSVIPHKKNESYNISYYKHIGIYAYKYSVLKKISNFKKTHHEKIEKLEQLRILDNGIKIKVMETKKELIGVDVIEDIKKIENIL